MKRIVIIIICLLLIGGLVFLAHPLKRKVQKGEETKKLDDSYIEVIPENANAFLSLVDANILLDQNAFTNYNEEILAKTIRKYDIENINYLNKTEIEDYITSYEMPSLPKYEGNTVWNKNNTQEILANRNLLNIKDTEVVKGMVTKRANLRSMPTNNHFYSSPSSKPFDALEETELAVNTPVLIIHESQDGVWYFIISKFYAGWVLKENIALCSDQDWQYFQNADNFIVITAANVQILDNTLLDMGVKLPYKGISANGYIVDVPSKDENGNLMRVSVTLSRSDAHLGFLPLTKRNIIIEAFKYEGVPYSWGGMDKGVDCSSYLANIFKTFGLYFPRNTSDQKNSVGTIISLTGKSSKEKLTIIEKYPVSLLYEPGHAMLYLGKLNQENYIIHANASDMKVAVSKLNLDNKNLAQIDRIILIDSES